MKPASIGLLGVFLCTPLLAGRLAAQPNPTYSHPVIIPLKDPISPLSWAYFQRKLALAKANQADLLVIEIDSPGGTLEESLLLAEALRDVDWAKTIAYIPDKALSGAALASLGCDEIILSSRARIGDAGIIFMDRGFAFRYAPEKLITDLVRRARDLAEFKGRPPALVEAMIDMDTLVFQNRQNPLAFETRRAANSGYPHRKDLETKDPNQFQQKLDLAQWQLVEESNEGRFFEVNGVRAVELGLGESNADTLEDLKAELKKRLGLENEFAVYRKTLTDVVVFWLNVPIVTGLLFVIGLVAIYLEFTAPGIGIGALIAGLCFSLFFWSHFLGGTAGWLELLLFIAGLVFVIIEMFVIPGFGIPGLAGLFLVIASITMASQDFIVPQNDRQMQTLQTNLLVVVGSGCLFLVGAVFLNRYLGKLPVFGKLLLVPPEQKQDLDIANADQFSQQHSVVSVGDTGTTESVLRPAGKARFGDHTVDVVADGSFIQPEETITVLQINGNRVLVVKSE